MWADERGGSEKTEEVFRCKLHLLTFSHCKCFIERDLISVYLYNTDLLCCSYMYDMYNEIEYVCQSLDVCISLCLPCSPPRLLAHVVSYI